MTEKDLQVIKYIIRGGIMEYDSGTLARLVPATNVDVNFALKKLKEDGLIEVKDIGGWNSKYSLTAKGLELNRQGTTYLEYQTGLEKREQERINKEAADKKLRLIQTAISVTSLVISFLALLRAYKFF